MMKNQLVTISEAVRLTGYSRSSLERAAHENKILLVEGKISKQDIDRILNDRDNYISLFEFACKNSTKRFDGRRVKHREWLRDVLEKNDYFGLDTFDTSIFLMANSRDMIFFRRSDCDKLKDLLLKDINLYGLSEKEKIKELMKASPDHAVSKQYIIKYIQTEMVEKKLTPSFLRFVEIMLEIPDAADLNDTDVAVALKLAENQAIQNYIIKWLKFVKRYCNVQYHEVSRKQKDRVNIPAYSKETYFELAEIFFNSKYIYDHDMIKKALDNHKYAEMWLYLSLFYVCGWRAGDVCQGWRYLDLAHRQDGCFGINKNTLYDDILLDRIPNNIYECVCLYCIGVINISGQIASKTASDDSDRLLVIISKEISVFFGLLTLIAESHMLRSGNGYMAKRRISDYQNINNLTDFFGGKIRDVLHNKNILTRRLNKDYLQAIESTGRKYGYGGILTSTLASVARNHLVKDTIKYYLNDYNLTGESADVVLLLMSERGVFGFEIYQTIMAAYPDALKKLSLADQNRIISQMTKVNLLKLEVSQSRLLAKDALENYFFEGSEQSALLILQKMYALTQGEAASSDPGVYCTRALAHQDCIYLNSTSCLKNACPHLILTRYAIIPLLRILQDLRVQEENGDKKAGAVLNKIIMPRFFNFINHFSKENNLGDEEKNGLKRIIKEELDG